MALDKKQHRPILAVGTLFLAAFAQNATASTKKTPFGALDDKCITNVPMDGRVDLSTGEIRVKGALVGHTAGCATHVPSCSGQGGWYEFSWANATTIGGLQQFNYLSETWTVPANPNTGLDTPLEYFFPSFQSETGPLGINGNITGIIQPVLSWGYDAQEWEVSSWGLFNCDQNCDCQQTFQSGPFPGVNAGDAVGGLISQYASNLDAWQIFISDSQTGAWANLDVYNIPNSWAKFNTAQSAVFEADSLTGCDDLSPSNDVAFGNIVIDQAGPAWNTRNNVTTSAAWSYFNNPKGLFPNNCSWNGGNLFGDAVLVWKE